MYELPLVAAIVKVIGSVLEVVVGSGVDEDSTVTGGVGVFTGEIFDD